MNQKIIHSFTLLCFICGFLSLATQGGANSYSSTAQLDTIPLNSGTAQTGSVSTPERDRCLLAQTQYTIFYPGRPAKMRIDVSGDQDIDLYVRFGQRVIAEPSRIIADARSLSHLNSESIVYPRSQLDMPEPGTYYIAVANCGTGPANFTIKASIITESDGDIVDLGFLTRVSGSVSAPIPNACILSQVQFRIHIGGPGSCGVGEIGFISSNAPGLTLYARFGQRVALENGRIAADFVSESFEDREFLLIASPNAGGPYYIAVNNCSFEDRSFSLIAGIGVGDPEFPFIRQASIRGKKLFVEGVAFHKGLVIFVDGVPQKTKPDENNPTEILIGGKAGRYIKRFGSFRLEIISAKGCRSSPFIFPHNPR
jgi:hypothetical protein